MKYAGLVVLFLVICRPVHAAQVDDSSQVPSNPFEVLNDVYLWSASGDVDDGWSTLDPIVVWDDLVLGESDTSTPSAGMEMTLDAMDMRTSATLRIASSQGANNTGTGTSLHVNELSFTGAIIVDDSRKTAGTDWQNKLVVHSLTSLEDRFLIRIGKDSLLEITQDGGSTITGALLSFDAGRLELDGGTLSVKDGLTLLYASIVGSGTITDSVTLNSNFLFEGNEPASKILVEGGDRQDYGKDVAIGSDGGLISVLGSALGDGVMNVKGTLRIDGANSDVSIGGDANGEGILRAGDVALSNNAKIDVLQYGRLELGTGETGRTAIIENGVINVDGGAAAFWDAFDMRSGGRVDLSNNAVMDISAVTDGVELSGGVLSAGTGTNSIATGAGALALAAPGILHATGELIVKANATDTGTPAGKLIGKAAGSIVVSDNGSLRTGELRADFASAGTGALFGSAVSDGTNVTPSGSVAAELFSVTTQTDVRGHNDVALTATYAAIDGTYRPGANDSVKNQATVRGTLAGSLAVGEAGQAGTVLLDGGTLDGTGGQVNLANAAAAKATLAVSGDSTVRGAVDASNSAGGGGFQLLVGGDLTLRDAASLAVESYLQTAGTVAGEGLRVKDSASQAVVDGATAVFAGSGKFDGGLAFANGATLEGRGNALTGSLGKQLHIDAASNIDLSSGGISVSGFDAISLEGALIAGAAHKLTLADETTLSMGMAARLEVGQSLASASHAAGSFSRDGAPLASDWIVSGAVSPWPGFSGDSHVVSNVFGDYTFRYASGLAASAGGGIWLDAYRAADITDTGTVLERLRRSWGTDRISPSFAKAVSGIAQNMADSAATGLPSKVGAYALPGSAAGATNHAILAAMAANDSQFTHGSLDGRMDASLLSAYTGHMAAGPLLAAMETGNVILRQIHNKLAGDREFARLIDQTVGSEQAAASAVMKERLTNRAWAGVLGVWQNADSRHGQAGFRYSGGGVLTGYDRVVGPATIGGSFGFVSGSYRDKSARAHDSTIDSYSFDAYASYALPANWHGTFALGYSLGDNDLREFRGGNWDKADYTTRTWHTGARIGYDWPANDMLTVSPALGLNYFHAAANSHSWRYDNAALLRYGSMTSDSVQMPVDVSLKYRRQFSPESSLTFTGGLGYIYTFNDDTLSGKIDINGLAGVRPVQAIGRRSGHHAYSLNSGLALVHQNLDVGLRYDLYGKPDFVSHQLTGSFGLSF